ncbi:protein ENHANCED DOWNY MILDEW 2-like isoform X2 [Magnolia sinica]|uniref:protein ENHANCED DOWNY MILDEW 2-like isoform X2 n=1 Tax=Magnolia sinica TaxID=86752 RepID=UPI00265AE4AC|nr:protein ENHANCED DOWNY MILDEW 2-like isoform X2 [Magnolia sinica]
MKQLRNRGFFLCVFLENSKKRTFYEDLCSGPDAKKSNFIVDDDEDMDEELEDEDEGSDMFDYVCAICDNGGEILCCEGKCLRSFHATRDAGVESDCKSLGMSMAQVKAVKNFFCLNCQYKQHQCFACGKLGSSDKSSTAEVFHCVSATCGHFYHPECIAKLLHPENEAEAEDHQRKIAAGESFTCPVHKCHICKQGENKDIEELQFAICRRCPRVYHRKCLPRKIGFSDSSDGVQRAWLGLIPNRILMYCMRHKIDEDLKTPIRNHIIFPNIVEKKNLHLLDSQLIKGKVMSKKKDAASGDSSKERISTKMPMMIDKSPESLKENDSSNRIEKPLSRLGFEPSKKSKTLDACKKPLKDGVKPTSLKVERSSSAEENRVSMKEVTSTNSKAKVMTSSKLQKIASPLLKKKSSNSAPVVGIETKNKILALMEKISSEVTLEEIMAKHNHPSTHVYTSRNVDKTITEGKVEGVVEAVRTALQKIEGGCSVEDAKFVCEPQILDQIIKWKKKLKVYLAPFLHGMRYTSFGRHFTKVEKLKEIVDKLHWYVQNGDMIVDFCCGANDFSGLMRDKLAASGKKCSFKNYDIIQAKDDFCFEKKDWMSVGLEELPTGSQLIMGLNPPFGVRASLANSFINKALEFKPKLLILIVPAKTERLDEKGSQYDLIWEDDRILSGKSFYLPGSVDVNEKQVDQWNIKAPPLYLWSRPDWTARHRGIAIKRGHISKDWTARHGSTAIKQGHISKDRTARHGSTAIKQGRMYEPQEELEEDHGFNMDISELLNNLPEWNDRAEASEETRIAVPKEKTEEWKGGSLPKCDGGRLEQGRCEDKGKRGAAYENHAHGKKRVHEDGNSRGQKCKHARRMTEKFPVTISPFNGTDAAMLLEQGWLGRGGRPVSIPDKDSRDVGTRYSSNREDPFASGTHKVLASGGSSSLGHGYGIQDKEHFPSHFGERNVETSSCDGYIGGRELVEKFGRPDADRLRQQVQLYGWQGPDDLSQVGRQPLGQYPGLGSLGSVPCPAFGLASPVIRPSRPNLSVSQRYVAPLLEETNHPRADPGVYESPVSQAGLHAGMWGFAPGPLRSFSPHQNSAGWLNE